MSAWPARLIVRSLTPDDAARIAGWRYPGRWQTYDLDQGEDLLSPAAGYFAVAGAGGGPLVGYCCSGAEARVPGLAGAEGVLDIGVGMDPERMEQGHGKEFGAAVLDHFRSSGAVRLRAVVQSWNERSLRLTRSLGFAETGTHRCHQEGREVEYTVLTMA